MVLPLINVVIVFHCLIFSIFFILKKSTVNRSFFFLGVALFCLAIMSLPFSLRPTGWIFYFPYFTDLEWCAGFFFAPFYLFFVKELIGEKIRFNYKTFLLFIPGIISFLYFSKFYFLSASDQLQYLSLIRTVYIQDYQIWDGIFYPYIQGYFIYIIILLSKKEKNRENNTLPGNLKWLKNFTGIMIFFGLCGFLAFFAKVPQIYIDLIPLSTGFLYMCLIYKFLMISEPPHVIKNVDTLIPTFEIPVGLIREERIKYSGSSLSNELVEELNSKLEKLMCEKKRYLNPNLTLQTLSQEIETSSHVLSQLLNQFHNKNFSDFINTYRIQNAKEKIQQETQMKLEVIGYECGFATKTTFNAAFKKHTGLTPSEYRKEFLEKEVQIYKN